MGVLKRLAGVSAAGAMFLLLTGAAQDPNIWPMTPTPADTTVLPVVTAGRHIDASISVCMYPGARPRQYDVVNWTCHGGSGTCTAFVAVPDAEAAILVTGYDLANPPVEATGPTCDRPEFRPTGRLGS